MENMFEYATRNKVRFPFKGQISVEDLWDLRADDLDTVFKTLNRQVKQSKEESLLTTKTAEDTALDIQIAIVKHIFDIKMQEANARLLDKERKAQKQKIMAILANKQKQELQNKSVDELQQMLEEI
nr:MAG TPA: hypothetical protein [Caudoviricetes sp.]